MTTPTPKLRTSHYEAEVEINRLKTELAAATERLLAWEAVAEKIPRLKDEYKNLTATAEVGGPDKTVWVSSECMNSERNATIERCAQVVENYFEYPPDPYRKIAEAIAAAIRKLKDET